MAGGQRSDFNALIGSLLRHSSFPRQMLLPSAGGVCVLRMGVGAQGLVKVRGSPTTEGLRSGMRCGVCARHTHKDKTRTQKRRQAFRGAERTAGRLRLLQGRCAAAAARSVSFPFQTPPPALPDTHTSTPTPAMSCTSQFSPSVIQPDLLVFLFFSHLLLLPELLGYVELKSFALLQLPSTHPTT